MLSLSVYVSWPTRLWRRYGWPASLGLSPSLPTYNAEKDAAYERLLCILNGSKPLELQLEFLFRSSRSDLMILEKSKKVIGDKNSLLHTGGL